MENVMNETRNNNNVSSPALGSELQQYNKVRMKIIKLRTISSRQQLELTQNPRPKSKITS